MKNQIEQTSGSASSHKLTLKQIREQFRVGDKWNATREGRALTVSGNLPPNNVQNQQREVAKVGSVDLVWKVPGKDNLLYTKWPKASEIIEARDGFIKFQYDNFVVVTLQRAN